jgi:hypothetical protein
MEQQLKRRAESDDTKAAKKTCKDAIHDEGILRDLDAIPDEGVLRDLIGDHFSENAMGHLSTDRFDGYLVMAVHGRISIDYQFKKFLCELVGLECTAREPAFFSKISENMKVPMQQFKACIAEKVFARDSATTLFIALIPHRRVMLEAYIEGLAALACDIEWDHEDDEHFNECVEGEEGTINKEKVENKLRAKANLKPIRRVN